MASRAPRRGDIDWNSVVYRAKEIVESYSTGVTLRQLYYRLVSEGLIPNHQARYKMLSAKTAQARREGWFPSLIDRTREIERYAAWQDARHAMEDAHDSFRLDRTRGQEFSIYIGVEKHGMTVQLMDWFGKLGIPVLALGGYSSQTFVDVVKRDVEYSGRKSVLLYAGDFDASGVDIDRDFEDRTEIFDEVDRVALHRKQIEDYNLPPMPGKREDARAAAFILKHGELIQVELDALPPEELRKLYQDAIDQYWNKDAYNATLTREAMERETISYLNDMSEMNMVDMAKRIVEDLDRRDDLLEVMGVAADKLF